VLHASVFSHAILKKNRKALRSKTKATVILKDLSYIFFNGFLLIVMLLL